MLYQISQGTKSFGTTEVFKNLQFEIKGNEKIALVGRNGSGKTTLLKIIQKEEFLDTGNIHQNAQVRIGVLSQIAFADESLSVEDDLLTAFQHLLVMHQQLKELEKQLQIEPNEKVMEQYAQALNTFEENGGYTYETEMKTVLTKMGFTPSLSKRSISTFSGGEKTRLAFAKLLLSKPDILLLDEPTNHLDMATIEWLEGYLSYYPKAIVFVSHDRFFLDKVANVIVEIEDYKTQRYTGNYSSYIQQKSVLQQKQASTYHRQQKEIERLETLIEKFRYKKSKAAFAQSKIKYLDRMERVEKPKSESRTFKANFHAKVRGAKEVLLMDQCAIGYEKPLATLSLQILRGQKIAVVGDNGTGKSTLLKTIVGQLPLLKGEMLSGHQIEFGYFDQQLAQFDSSKTVLEEIWDEFSDLDKTEIRTVLGRFLFVGDDVFKLVSVLSGGEKVRLCLAKLMLKQANFLILDEPTNHLDLLGKEALEESLKDYTGTLLFVSHDRYFIEKLATAKLIFSAGKVEFDKLNKQEYVSGDKQDEGKLEKKQERLTSLKQRKEWMKECAKTEKTITEVENNLAILREKRFDPEYYHDYNKMKELDDMIDDAVNQVARYLVQWEQLVEALEGENNESV